MSRYNNIAIIPARGGSKGIPKKNIAPIFGKPLIGHTIGAALKSTSVDLVVVSTDDNEIAAVSRDAGAYVIMRPAEISGDTATSESALVHAIEHLAENGMDSKYITFLQCTSPLTVAEDIDGTFNKLVADGADTALAVCRFFHFLWQDKGTGASGINHDKSFRLRRQDMEPQYLETGSVYIMETNGFLASRHRFFGKTVFYPIPAERVFEIDEPQDLVIAEILMSKFMTRDESFPKKVEAVIMDFDGVFTDNKVIVFQNGEEAVVCSRGDGMGISHLLKLNIPAWVISKERNPVLKHRCEKLGLPCDHAVDNKLDMLKKQLAEKNIDPRNVIYVGNDVNDLECMGYVGWSVAVADSHPDVLKVAKVILKNNGGNGALRELADRIAAIAPEE